MNVNIGYKNRIIRVIIGVIILGFILNGTLTGSLAVVSGLLGALLGITGIIGYCPFMTLLRLNSSSNQQNHR